jgi:hypothetical protein
MCRRQDLRLRRRFWLVDAHMPRRSFLLVGDLPVLIFESRRNLGLRLSRFLYLLLWEGRRDSSMIGSLESNDRGARRGWPLMKTTRVTSGNLGHYVEQDEK